MNIRFSLITAAALGIMLLGGCNRQGFNTRTYDYECEADHSDFSMMVELPVSTQGAAGMIREELINIMDDQLSHIGSYEGDRMFPQFAGDRSNTSEVLQYYKSNGSGAIESHALEFYDEVRQYMEEEEDGDPDLIPRCEYDFNLTKEYETDRCIVFLSEDFAYMGGAHGGISGQGSVTFDKRDGKRFTNFLRAGAQEQMQSLLEGGLVEYFSDAEGSVTAANIRELLFLDEGSPIIPLPTWAPAPARDGLCFTYQQYEIAAYAMGMPSFTIPYDDIKPYLTPEAADLLKLN